METELLPGVRLTYDLNIANDSERFHHVFLLAWELMPNGIRRVIASHWAKQPAGPLVEFIPFVWNPKKGNVAAQTLDRGHRVQFNQYIFNLCETELFRAAVAMNCLTSS